MTTEAIDRTTLSRLFKQPEWLFVRPAGSQSLAKTRPSFTNQVNGHRKK
jgi:hypothetical protein